MASPISPLSNQSFQPFEGNSPIFDNNERYSGYRPPSIADSLYSANNESIISVSNDAESENDQVTLATNNPKPVPIVPAERQPPAVHMLRTEEAGRGTRRVWWRNIKVDLLILVLILTIILLLIFGIIRQVS